jgi:tRNA threonylcarbamoyl adenosine modification protein (Sua5/YciO/YrdC/YwlC family)
MTQLLTFHPLTPQLRLAKQVAAAIQADGVVAYPTDSGYALGCRLNNKAGMDTIRQIRGLDEHHLFTLVCRDLSELATYAVVENPAFRLLKAHTPGPYTFILKATHQAPRRLQHPKRKTIGLRIPDNKIALALLDALGEPLVSVSLKLPDFDVSALAMEAHDIYTHLKGRVALVVDGGSLSIAPTTVIELFNSTPHVIREGGGNPELFARLDNNV